MTSMATYTSEDFSELARIKPTSNDGKSMLPMLISLLNGFQEKIRDMFEGLQTEFRALVVQQEERVEKLEHEIDTLKLKVTHSSAKIDENESYERRDTLILSGDKIPAVAANENCAEIVRGMLRDTLSYNVSMQDISVAHRLGSKPKHQRADKRNLIVKFCKRNIKNDILAAGRRVKPAGLYLGESLTPQRQSIAYVLRKARRERPDIISGTYTSEGSVIVWVKPPNPSAPGAKNLRNTINTVHRLEEFCTKALGKPISHYLDKPMPPV